MSGLRRGDSTGSSAGGGIRGSVSLFVAKALVLASLPAIAVTLGLPDGADPVGATPNATEQLVVRTDGSDAALAAAADP